MNFTVAWPHNYLWKNDTPRSKHALNRVYQAARTEAAWAGIAAGLKQIKGHKEYAVLARFTAPQRPGPERDENSRPHSIAAHLDGIADVLEANDANFRMAYDHTSREGEGRVEFAVFPFEGEIS